MVSIDEKIAAVRRGERVLVDGPHHSQRRTVKRMRSGVPALVELHTDAITGVPVDIYDAAMNAAGTVTWVYLPPAPPMPAASAGAVLPRS